jgi:succinate dehydrogenase/fumarate reductase flavoprotein subunit
MWTHCGLVRSRDGLLEAREALGDLASQSARVTAPGPREANPGWQQSLDLVSQITVARLIVESALTREESRGAHFRSDHPARNDDRWLRAVIAVRGQGGGPSVSTRPVELTRLAPDGRAVAFETA